MVSQSSPFRPGYNRRPPLLAGRDRLLASVDEALASAAVDGDTPPALLVVGARGVGKTVLLEEIAERAGQRYGWPRLHVEVTPHAPFAPDLIAAAADLVAQFDEQSQGGLRVREAVLSAGVGPLRGEVRLDRDPQAPADSGLELQRALTAAAEAAAQRGGGFVLTIDEVQEAERIELGKLAAIMQRGVGLGWPVVMVGAGLAGMRDPGRAASYFERADWHEIGPLSPAETLAALRVPAEAAGRPFDDDALEVLLRASGGYPYAVQLYGHHAWRASAGQPRIVSGAAEEAVRTGNLQLDAGLYAQRWAQASGTERSYLATLAALLEDRASARGAEVASVMGATTRQMGTIRDRLIKKGTITAQGERLMFVVPGLAEYIRRQVAES